MPLDLQAIIADVVPVDTPPQQVAELARMAFSELEERVGTRLANRLSMSALHAFEEACDAGNDEMMSLILESECPNYRDLVAEEINQLVADVAKRLAQ